jgi:hypothetical protein
MKHNISQRRATLRVPEVDDRNNKPVAEAGSKRGAQPKAQSNRDVMHSAHAKQQLLLMPPYERENSIFSVNPVLSDRRVLYLLVVYFLQ